MKTDREVLELAAKAAGIKLHRWMGDVQNKYLIDPNFDSGLAGAWNPLTDDGDALRLAVKLKLQVIIYSDWVEVLQDGIRKSNADSVYDAGCMFGCTRRAIILAAAAIGENS